MINSRRPCYNNSHTAARLPDASKRRADDTGNGEYVLPQAVTLSPEAAQKLIDSADGAAALLYIYILKNGGRLDLAAAANELRLADGGKGALGALQRMGLVAGGSSAKEKPAAEQPRALVQRPDTLPDYTSEDVKNTRTGNPEFAELVDEVQKILGTVLNANALIDLLGFYDYLGLPPDVILLMVSHCAQECEKKYGPGRRPAMRDVRNEAYRWAKREIRTLEAATEYIKNSESAKKRKLELRRMLGIDSRSLSPTEDRYVTAWAEADYTDELIMLAYDKTITNTGRLAWKYMGAILSSWAEKGLKTEADIREGDKRETPARRDNTPQGGDNGEFEQLKKYRDKLRES